MHSGRFKQLKHLFEAVIRVGRIPVEWKRSYICPIPKKGVISEIANYRGISMQSCIPKLFDKILTGLMQKYIGPQISDAQHGFRSGRGTQSNLIEISQFIHEQIQGKGMVEVIYFDYSKAFDTISYRVLARKLAELAVPFNLYLTIMDFVVKRTYQIKMNNKITPI